MPRLVVPIASLPLAFSESSSISLPLDYKAILDEYSAYAERLEKFCCDTGVILYDAIKANKRIDCVRAAVDSGYNLVFEFEHGFELACENVGRDEVYQ